MHSNPIFSQAPNSSTYNSHLNTQENESENYLSIAEKTSVLIISLILSIATFTIIGPFVGTITAVICGVGLIWLFDSHYPDLDHSRTFQATIPSHTTCYKNPSYRVHSIKNFQNSHVPVGKGHVSRKNLSTTFSSSPSPGHHVPVDQGHFSSSTVGQTAMYPLGKDTFPERTPQQLSVQALRQATMYPLEEDILKT